jgi:hypothetical protein
MKYLILALALIATPAAAGTIGKPGDCPSTRNGKCETVQDWWLEQMLHQ